MTATEVAAGVAAGGGRSAAAGDTLTIAWRNLLRFRRLPQLMVFTFVQPVMIVLLFRYVFGGAIRIPGVDYVDYLMAGAWSQAMMIGSISTGIGLAEDVSSGIIERFRALPMARSAVLAGRTVADVVKSSIVVVIMVVVGFAVGFELHTNVASLVAAMLLLVGFGFSVSWFFAFIGLTTGTPETAQAASFPIIFPLMFASSAFVPTQTMPDWLQPFAENQPFSRVVDAVRALTLGGPTTEAVLWAVAWMVAIVAVFAPLAVMRYRRI